MIIVGFLYIRAGEATVGGTIKGCRKPPPVTDNMPDTQTLVAGEGVFVGVVIIHKVGADIRNSTAGDAVLLE